MYRDGARLVVSASDLVGFLACEHLTSLDFRQAAGEPVSPPRVEDAQLTLLARRGFEHERRYLLALQERLNVFVINDHDVRAAAAATEAALCSAVAAIYQGAFWDDSDETIWRGHADFMLRVDTASDLGAFSYEPTDAKLAHRVRPSAVLQLCHYAEQIERIQGCSPEWLHVFLGGGVPPVSLRHREFSAYYRAAKRRFLESLGRSLEGIVPEPVEHCSVCKWTDSCQYEREQADHLSLVAGLGREQARKLTRLAGISTLSQLATSSPESVIRISSTALARFSRQARLQLESRARPGPPTYELLDATEPGIGLAGLPEPCIGDVFFDIEGDPFIGHGGLEYLLGVGWEDEGRFQYRSWWAHNPEEERKAFEGLIDFLLQRSAAFPDMHVYHYAPYERTALGRLMGRHATREEEVDVLLRGQVLVDLLQVVRQGVCIGTPSYSLKKLEALYMGPRTEAIIDAGSSIAEYERWLENGEDQILADIESYNRVDCNSTRLLRFWLEERRDEFERVNGRALPRPIRPEEAQPTDEAQAEATEVAALKDSLARHAVGSDAINVQASWLLGELLDWHRRETKPEWWAWFNRVLRCTEDDLYSDSEAIAGLRYEGVVDEVDRSLVHRYSFDPAQEHKLAPGADVNDPMVERRRLSGERVSGPGALVAVDPVAGHLDLRRSATSRAAHPHCLIPGQPYRTKDQRSALRRLAEAVVGHGIDGTGRYRAARDLLLRRPPRRRGGVGPLSSANPTDSVVATALDLDGGCLAVQGPPGSGKTYTAARAIVALVRAGRKVGITANSHAVIGNLLSAVSDAAARDHVEVRVVQKADESQAVESTDVTVVSTADEVERLLAEGEVDVVAGTAWLFCREGLDSSLDDLVVDEAGQLSLANVLALSTTARNLILVGDPRQLAQPSKGTHPPGSDASGLDHLLAGSATIDPDLGIFLDRTRRLHPEICAFVSEIVYDGRLSPLPATAMQRIGGTDGLAGAGLRWVPIEHAGNRTASEEEADAICRIVGELLGRPWWDQGGAEQTIRAGDVLVVAPYNAQVDLLAECLGEGIRVGTVDKFQGQEAPVCIVSMAASSAEGVPRGMEFLFSRNRFNVAVSRAQALVVLVASPSLLSTPCRTVEQIRLVNNLCRYVELGETVPVGQTG